jgi:hypothetical protein
MNRGQSATVTGQRQVGLQKQVVPHDASYIELNLLRGNKRV